jgi:hypothetical protein
MAWCSGRVLVFPGRVHWFDHSSDIVLADVDSALGVALVASRIKCLRTVWVSAIAISHFRTMDLNLVILTGSTGSHDPVHGGSNLLLCGVAGLIKCFPDAQIRPDRLVGDWFGQAMPTICKQLRIFNDLMIECAKPVSYMGHSRLGLGLCVQSHETQHPD